MKTLNCKKRTFIEVDYNDLEDFAKEIYGFNDYSFVACQECGNDSVHEFEVDGKIDNYDEDNAKKIRNGENPSNYQNSLLLNCLCADGYIEAGNYIIKVCW